MQATNLADKDSTIRNQRTLQVVSALQLHSGPQMRCHVLKMLDIHMQVQLHSQIYRGKAHKGALIATRNSRHTGSCMNASFYFRYSSLVQASLESEGKGNLP